MQLIEKIIKDVSAENVVQIVTDHKACINLMLKDIGEWPDHKACIESAKRICSWLYNSNSLHHMMKKAIGGELVKWNATRFGTNYMFLDREEEEFRSDDTTPEPSGDDGGRGFDGDDDDEDDTGGSDDGDAGGSGWVRGSGGAGGSSGQVSPLQFTGKTNFTMPHRIKIMVHPPHNDKREAVDELDLLQSTHRICNPPPPRIGEGCHRHRYRNNLFILPFGYQVRMDCRCVSV